MQAHLGLCAEKVVWCFKFLEGMAHCLPWVDLFCEPNPRHSPAPRKCQRRGGGPVGCSAGIMRLTARRVRTTTQHQGSAPTPNLPGTRRIIPSSATGGVRSLGVAGRWARDVASTHHFDLRRNSHNAVAVAAMTTSNHTSHDLPSGSYAIAVTFDGSPFFAASLAKESPLRSCP